MIGPIHFIKNKYYHWYMQICNRALQKRDGITHFERHHIYPKSFGGMHKDRAYLSYREHFLVHWLLIKFTTGRARMKMSYAITTFQAANNKYNRIVSGWQYERIRLEKGIFKHTEESKELMSFVKRKGKPKPPLKLKAPIGRYKRTEETLAKMRKPKTEAHRKALSQANKNKIGIKVTDGERIFDNMGLAATHHNVTIECIRYRIKAPRQTDWQLA